MNKIIKEIHLESPYLIIKNIVYEEVPSWDNSSIFAGAKIVASRKHRGQLRKRSYARDGGALLFYDLCQSDADAIRRHYANYCLKEGNR